MLGGSTPINMVEHWPYLPVLTRVLLAVALGLFVGMERERRGKEAGIRTFAFVSLLGCLCGLLGDAYALLSLVLLGILIVFLNWQRLVTNQTAELTTSAALVVTGVMGVLCGKGHHFTPALVGILTAALLAWKERMTRFSLGLTGEEVRSAILLAILAFVIYPVLPEQALDPWGLVKPRSAWVTVLLLAAVGFGNYILLKVFGTRGAVLSGFLGGLVNTTVVVTELATRARDAGSEEGDEESPLFDAAYKGIVLATAAMALRNGILLALLAPQALVQGALLPLLLMLSAGLILVGKDWKSLFATNQDNSAANRGTENPEGEKDEPHRHEEAIEEADETNTESPHGLRLKSPFSLASAFKFGLIFLALNVGGTLAQRWLGAWGVYVVSIVGGAVSSGSAVASAGSLAAHGGVSPTVAGIGAVLASFASALVNLTLMTRIGNQPRLSARVSRALVWIIAAGILGALLQVCASPTLGRLLTMVSPTTASPASSGLNAMPPATSLGADKN